MKKRYYALNVVREYLRQLCGFILLYPLSAHALTLPDAVSDLDSGILPGSYEAQSGADSLDTGFAKLPAQVLHRDDDQIDDWPIETAALFPRNSRVFSSVMAADFQLPKGLDYRTKILAASFIPQVKPGAANYTGNRPGSAFYGLNTAVGPLPEGQDTVDSLIESDQLLIFVAVVLALAGYCRSRWRQFVFSRSRHRSRLL